VTEGDSTVGPPAAPGPGTARGARLPGPPAPELVRAGHTEEVAQAFALARALSLADLAHAVALAECGAIDAATAAALLGGLLDLDAIPPEDFPWDPERGDAFNNRESELRERIGTPAGWLTAGRPRREAFRVALRMVARDGLVGVHGPQIDLATALVDQAERHAADLAADYTYLQPAQPTTVGHLLLAHAEPVLRDAERLRRAHAWLDRSPAGAGGSAGSRWPVDRARLAELLGFGAVAVHTRDAMWAADGYVELVADLALALTHVSQLAQDLEILASREFGVVELDDAHSRQSDLMPQKKNPYALAVLRAAAGMAAGDLATVLTTLHTGSARTDHYQVLNGLVPALLERARAAEALAAAVIAGMTVDTERAAGAAHSGFVVAADLADVLAAEAGIDYRSAHTVVGRALRRLAKDGRDPSTLTAEDLAAAAEKAIDRPVDIDPVALADALDPAACLRRRSQEGTASPREMARMIDAARAEADGARAWATAVSERAASAEAALLARAAELAGRPPLA